MYNVRDGEVDVVCTVVQHHYTKFKIKTVAMRQSVSHQKGNVSHQKASKPCYSNRYVCNGWL